MYWSLDPLRLLQYYVTRELRRVLSICTQSNRSMSSWSNRCARETGAIVTAEEHTIVGGLGGAVAECLAGVCPVPLEGKEVGLNDTFAECGPYPDLLDKYGMSVEAITSAVRRALKRKSTYVVSTHGYGVDS